MIHFDCDYLCGAHPEVLDALGKTNMELTPGYGFDAHTENAKRLIREACGIDDADVFLMVGGTQTNATVIDGILKSYEGVMAAESGHINVHESGAIEAAGHKVLTLPQHEGKIRAAELQQYLKDFYGDDTWPHMVIPGMVYLTFPTEFGTVYSLSELEQISAICREYKLPLFIDGARLGYGLAAPGGDVTLHDIARLSDVFYIGGTKEGLLFGEAVVARKDLLPNFFTQMKQHGAVLAKGRLLGVQFEMLFTDNLYGRISEHAVSLAMKLRQGFVDCGFSPAVASPTNQQFFTLPNAVIEKLQTVATFEYWGPKSDVESTVRFVTHWATTEEDVKQLLAALKK